MPAITNTEIYIALRDHLKTYSGLPFVAYPMDTYTPPTGANGLPSIYWIVQDMRLPVTSRLAGYDDPDEYRGDFQVHIMAPEEITHSQLMYQVGLIANHFPKGLGIWTSSGKVEVIETPYLAAEPYRDGTYHRAPVLVRWRLSG